MKKIIWSLLFLIFLGCNVAFSIEEKTTVKVGISNSSFSTFEHSSVTLILNGEASITDMTENKRKSIPPNSVLKITYNNNSFKITVNNSDDKETMRGPITIVSSDKIGIEGLKRKVTPAYYRGMIELKNTKGDKFNIINILDMQTYLKGVVPNEMPISFGLEALKAQAIAAKNYANRPMNANPNYDVCDSTACQVYYGANSQTSISDKAVDETLGIYALYNKEVILALYSSTAGGITEDYVNTFGNFTENKPYLKSVSDTVHLKKLSKESYFKKEHPSFDMKSPKYRWQKTFSKDYLEEILPRTLIEQSKAGAVEPKLLNKEGFGELKDITVLKRGTSNKALEVEIKTTKGNYIVKKELPIRRVFREGNSILPSANFIVEKKHEHDSILPEKNKNDKEVVFQNNENEILRNNIKESIKDKILNRHPENYIFYGVGFGHGVGMSQFGAGYLSYYGVPYENILKHYYTGITLGTIPKNVLYNKYGITYNQEFYYDKTKTSIKHSEISKSPLKKELNELTSKDKGCFLTIENNDKVQSVEFYINGYYFNPDLRGFKKKVLKTEITKYLIAGNNKIIFNPLKETDKKKKLTFYVTFGEEND